MRLPLSSRGRHRTDDSRGQSLTELALFLPVLLLLVLVALDFGRVYLGWINLQQMARIAANFAADNALDWPADQGRYEQLLENESTLINCTPDETTWDPQYGADISLGQHVTVEIQCEFTLITPIISQILGTSITASASATYPIKDGIVGSIPGGGGPVTPAPDADFTASPLSGWGPLTVTFTDASTNAPATWSWNFASSSTGTSPSATPSTASGAGPHTVVYDCGGAEGETCTFSVSLTAENSGGNDTETKTGLITVTVPPATGPLVDFAGAPQSGTEPLTVDFTTTIVRGPVTTYAWDFGDGDTIPAGTDDSPTHVYDDPGDYTVTLIVSDGTVDNTLVKTAYIHVDRRICTVPDFQNKWRFAHPSGDPGAQALWAAAGFTTTLTTLPNNSGQPGSNYRIQSQTLTGGTIDPLPDGCDSSITVGP